MSDNVLKVVPAPESKTSPEAATAAPAKSARAPRDRPQAPAHDSAGRAAVAGGADRRRRLSHGRALHLDRQRLCRRAEGADHARHFRQGRPRRRARRPARQAGRRIAEARSRALSNWRWQSAQAKLDTARSDYDKLKSNLDLAHHAGRAGAEECRAQAARRRAQAQTGGLAGRLAGRRRHLDGRAGDRAIAGAIHQAAARRHAQLVARQSRPADRRVSRICAGQGRARQGAARPRPHRAARADRRHRDAGRQYPARPLRRRRRADPERDRRQRAVGRRQSEGDRHHLSARRAEGDARRRLVSPTTPSTAPSSR